MIRHIYFFILSSIMVICGTSYASFLHSAQFPKTAADISFQDKMDIMAADYENYADLSPYQKLQLITDEDVAHAEIARLNAKVCKEEGVACDKDTPVSDGSTYYVPTEQTPPTEQTSPTTAETTTPVVETPTPTPTIQTPSYTQPGTNAPRGTATGYCSVRNPDIPQGQTIPLGSPVYFEELSNTASQRSKKIANNSMRGMFCSPYGCRKNGTASGRPHEGIDIGCTADFFDMPIYTPADGVVTTVKKANGGSAGNYIRIQHSNGWETQYMHLEKVFVTKGQNVSAGCVIATMGYTGGNRDQKHPHMDKNLTHLHYEVIFNGGASTLAAPNGTKIPIVRGGDHACGNFKAKIKPDDFVTYYYKNK